MAHRAFTDDRGRKWEAWDVHPTSGDRRHAERRTAAREPMAEDRRNTMERRQRRQTTGSMRRVSDLQDGWLCFDCGEEKRRLAPIPDDWHQCGMPRLLELLASAGVVVRVTGRSC